MENSPWFVQIRLTIKGPKEPAQIGEYTYAGTPKEVALAIEQSLKNLDVSILEKLSKK